MQGNARAFRVKIWSQLFQLNSQASRASYATRSWSADDLARNNPESNDHRGLAGAQFEWQPAVPSDPICLCPQRLNGKIKIANCMMKRLWSTHWLHASEANSTSEAEELNEEMKVISRAKRCTAVERCRAIQMGAAWCSTNTHESTNSYKFVQITPYPLDFSMGLSLWSKRLARFDSEGLAGLGFADLPSLERKGSLSWSDARKTYLRKSCQIWQISEACKTFHQRTWCTGYGRISRSTLSSPRRTKLWTGRPSALSFDFSSRSRDEAW